MNDYYITNAEEMINPNGQDFNTYDYTINQGISGTFNPYTVDIETNNMDSIQELIHRVKNLKDPNITQNITMTEI